MGENRGTVRSASGPFDEPGVVAAYEDWYSTRYGRLADELERGLLADLLGPLPEGSSLLEIGCGTGHFGEALASQGQRVFGVDRSASMVQRARGRFPVVLADAQDLPFANRSFDAAIVIAVLDFVADPVAVLREARRVTRGEVVVLALVSHSLLALRRRLSGWRGHPIFAAARFHSRRRLLDFARRAGVPARDPRQILVLPPSLAARCPGIERLLSRRNLGLGGILGFRLAEHATPAAQIDDLS